LVPVVFMQKRKKSAIEFDTAERTF
jgi:hypothetical protein